MVVSVGELKGAPEPGSQQELEVGTKAPVITYSYRVTYEFVEGEELEDGSSTEVCAGQGLESSRQRQATARGDFTSRLRGRTTLKGPGVGSSSPGGGYVWQDKSLLATFPVPLGEPSAALGVGRCSQVPSC